MSLPNNIKEWYQQFLNLAEAEGVNINSPDSGSMFKSINISVHSRMHHGEQETEYRDDGNPISAPLDEADAHRNDPMWLFKNTCPISRMTEDQIRNLYQLAQEGKVVFTTVVNNNGEPKRERKIIYTGTDSLPHFSGPLSQGPVIEDGNEVIPPNEAARLETTFPNASDPIALAKLSTQMVKAANITMLNFALTGKEQDARIATGHIYAALVNDRQNHPNYYEKAEDAELRSRIVASGTYKSSVNPQGKVPPEYQVEGEYHFQIAKGLENNILSISTAGMSLDDMITAGLIRNRHGEKYTHGQKPWDALTELAGERDKVIQVYRPGENGGEPQLDGTITMHMDKGLLGFKKTRTEKSAQKKETEETFEGVEAHKTVYGGVHVISSQKNKLDKQPAAEFLAFDQNPDGSYTMRYKLPEMGRAGTKEFKIRENINYFIRGVSKMCFDRDGNPDFNKFDEFYDEFANSSVQKLAGPAFAEKFGIPEDKRADFSTFVRAMDGHDIFQIEMSGFDDMIFSLRQFQAALDDLYQPDQPVDAAKEKLLMESYGDFKKKLDNLHKMASMDPETETNVYNYNDCGYSATLNKNILPKVNEYRTQRNQPPVTVPETAQDSIGGRINIPIASPDRPDNPAKQMYNSFKNHAGFAVNAKLNGRDVLLSMETTAPRAGKILFSDSRGETAMGIFKDKAELIAFHQKDSYYCVAEMDAFLQLKRVPKARAKQIKNATGSHIIETKLRTGVQTSRHTVEELTKRLSSWKVDNPLIASSPEFAVMKQYFQEFTNAETPADKLRATMNLNIAAQVYLDYKEPKGDAVKTAALSDYANRRLEFVRDVLDYTSAKLNKVGAKLPIVPEVKQRQLMERNAQERYAQSASTNPQENPQMNQQSKKDPVSSLGSN